MLICAAGVVYGARDRRCQDVFAFEASPGVRFDHVLHVSDFDIWPDPRRFDKATRHHDGVGDFPAWLRANRGAPQLTLAFCCRRATMPRLNRLTMSYERQAGEQSY
jgi:hypothetical protein